MLTPPRPSGPTPTKRRTKKGKGSLVRPAGRVRTWAIKWVETVGGKKQRKYRGGYQTQDEAVRMLAGIMIEVRAGRPGIPVAPPAPKVSPLIADLVEDFLAQRLRNKVDDANRWERDLEPLVSHRKLDTIDNVLVDDLVTGLKTTKSGATAERALFLLSSFYRWAIRMGHTTTNPVRVYLASLHRGERREIHTKHDPKDTPFIESKADLVKLFKVLPTPVNLALALSALAGLRPGEALALEWSDVDLERGIITVRQQVRHGRIGPTKSGKPRDVPIVPGLLAVLKAAKAVAKKPLVVPSSKGKKHLGPKTIATALELATAKVGLPELTYYEAGRHTFASQWVLAGLDVYRLMEIMGHASVTTTQRYAHLTKKTPAAMLERADVALGA